MVVYSRVRVILKRVHDTIHDDLVHPVREHGSNGRAEKRAIGDTYKSSIC